MYRKLSIMSVSPSNTHIMKQQIMTMKQTIFDWQIIRLIFPMREVEHKAGDVSRGQVCAVILHKT